MLPWVFVAGISGRDYRYFPYDRFGNWRDLPANYAFACVNAVVGGWRILYFG